MRSARPSGRRNPLQPPSNEPLAAQGQDDTLGVVWDVPKEGGGYFSEAVCWIEGCEWRWTSDKRDEVEREFVRHQEEAHDGCWEAA